MGFEVSAERAGSTVSRMDPYALEARDCLNRQAAAISALEARVDGVFGRAVRKLNQVGGHVVVTGLGKSGLIGKKIAATLASTGTPSFFMHAGEALHGDLGMITDEDAVLLISYSGETSEVVALLPHLRSRGVQTVALVGRMDSTLARNADIAIDVSVDQEICPHNLVPTNSSLAALAMGDALAMSLMRLRGFDRDDFRRVHPSGSVGRRSARVDDLVIRDDVCVLHPDDTIQDALMRLAGSPHGTALVCEDTALLGVVTAATIQAVVRRDAGTRNTLASPVRRAMNDEPPIISNQAFVAEAERQLSRETTDRLVVVCESGKVLGLYASVPAVK